MTSLALVRSCLQRFWKRPRCCGSLAWGTTLRNFSEGRDLHDSFAARDANPGGRAIWAEKRKNRDSMSGREHFDPQQGRRHDSEDHQPDGPGDFEQRFLLGKVSALGKARRWEEALQIFRSVAEPGQKLRLAAMAACARSLKLEKAEELFYELPTKTVQAYNILMSALARLRRIGEIEKMLQTMEHDKLQPTAITYGTLMNAYGMVQDSASAMRAFNEMKQRGLTLSTVTFASALAACARAGDKEAAAGLIEEMSTCMLRPELGHYTSLIVSCVRDKDEAKAWEFFTEMRRNELKPDVVTYTGLMATVSGEDSIQKAEAIFVQMQEAGVVPDAFVYNELMKVALAAEKPNKCRDYYRQMLDAGISPTRESELRLRQLSDLEESLLLRRSTQIPLQVNESDAALPAGWQEAKDLATGHSYYWHQSDPAGTTTWSRPRV